jgi:hypothetical protein
MENEKRPEIIVKENKTQCLDCESIIHSGLNHQLILGFGIYNLMMRDQNMRMKMDAGMMGAVQHEWQSLLLGL